MVALHDGNDIGAGKRRRKVQGSELFPIIAFDRATLRSTMLAEIGIIMTAGHEEIVLGPRCVGLLAKMSLSRSTNQPTSSIHISSLAISTSTDT